MRYLAICGPEDETFGTESTMTSDIRDYQILDIVNLIEMKFAYGIIEKRRMYFQKNESQIHKITDLT